MATESRDALEKTTRINLLFDLYGALLTDKQVEILTFYFREDFSLGEIAAELGVSRQAVYEHVKRGGLLLEDYESKLGLLARLASAGRLLDELDAAASGLDDPSGPGERIRSLGRELRETLLDIDKR
ncbi:YlxM family DNA-binding protein [Paenibacillus pasadenensis]|uniref:UPF0122 protein B8V81_4658 n=1 Tax=Paenibacillus pasadenensis TaxID=217090 RepID=A0A2N5N795_9BACL|nr:MULTISPECIES: YlxM family DNA-binding protein [Paenibacillus]PLT46227.1 Signal recognition particle associated protein [Paenibacillus pasadenensis]QGG56683.1 HTH domain-containing protein [Paenibacillus sp. B01]